MARRLDADGALALAARLRAGLGREGYAQMTGQLARRYPGLSMALGLAETRPGLARRILDGLRQGAGALAGTAREADPAFAAAFARVFGVAPEDIPAALRPHLEVALALRAANASPLLKLAGFGDAGIEAELRELAGAAPVPMGAETAGDGPAVDPSEPGQDTEAPETGERMPGGGPQGMGGDPVEDEFSGADPALDVDPERPLAPAAEIEDDIDFDFELDAETEAELRRQLDIADGDGVVRPTAPALDADTEANTSRVESEGFGSQLAKDLAEEWEKAKKFGLRRYLPPELLQQFDAIEEALPTREGLVEFLIDSVTFPEAEEMFEANRRFRESVGEGDIGAATSAAVKWVTSFSILVLGLFPGGKGATASFQALKRTPGSGTEASRLTVIATRTRPGQPGDFFKQAPAAAFRSTAFPPNHAAENVRRGLAAIDMAIQGTLRGGSGVVTQAMHRADVGSVSFYWGIPGTPPKYRRGSGLSHIIAKHGVEVLEDVIHTIARGTSGFKGQGKNRKLELVHGGNLVILKLFRDGNRETWLLSGYKIGDPKKTDIPFDLSQIKGPVYFDK